VPGRNLLNLGGGNGFILTDPEGAGRPRKRRTKDIGTCVVKGDERTYEAAKNRRGISDT